MKKDYIRISLYQYLITEDKRSEYLVKGTKFIVYLIIGLISINIFLANAIILNRVDKIYSVENRFFCNVEVFVMGLICCGLVIFLKDCEAVGDIIISIIDWVTPVNDRLPSDCKPIRLLNIKRIKKRN